MQFRNRKVIYDEAELAVFVPIWSEISKDVKFKSRIEQMRDLILLADEASLGDGSSPLLPDIYAFNEEFATRVKSITPNISDSSLRDLRFYCLYHTEDSFEFDIEAASREAVEKLKLHSK